MRARRDSAGIRRVGRGLGATNDALTLWRGAFLEDLRDQPWVAEEATRVAELFSDCLDVRITELPALGRAKQALGEVARLRAVDPLAGAP